MSLADTSPELGTSDFVSGLAELTARRTESGAGLHRFLAENVKQLESPVADVIMQLAQEVTQTNEEQHV